MLPKALCRGATDGYIGVSLSGGGSAVLGSQRGLFGFQNEQLPSSGVETTGV